MRIHINNPTLSTSFLAISLFAALFSLRKGKREVAFISQSTSRELKGLAILMVIFAHIGYFLSYDDAFLFPFSIMGGVGVDIFLLLSGFGLVQASPPKISQGSIEAAYSRRLPRLYLPLWISLSAFFALDFFAHKISYAPASILLAFLGATPSASIYSDPNSPLWYFTFILIYYLTLPLVFSKKHPWLGTLFIFIASGVLLVAARKLSPDVAFFYELHIFAFPLGTALGTLALSLPGKESRPHPSLPKKTRIALMISLMSVVTLGSYYLGSFPLKGQAFLCPLLAIATTLIFTIKKSRFILLSILGRYSYEIYLTHWPILLRYDFLYALFPAWIATLIYIPIFILLGFLLSETAFRLRLFLRDKLHPEIHPVFPQSPKNS